MELSNEAMMGEAIIRLNMKTVLKIYNCSTYYRDVKSDIKLRSNFTDVGEFAIRKRNRREPIRRHKPKYKCCLFYLGNTTEAEKIFLRALLSGKKWAKGLKKPVLPLIVEEYL